MYFPAQIILSFCDLYYGTSSRKVTSCEIWTIPTICGNWYKIQSVTHMDPIVAFITYSQLAEVTFKCSVGHRSRNAFQLSPSCQTGGCQPLILQFNSLHPGVRCWRGDGLTSFKGTYQRSSAKLRSLHEKRCYPKLSEANRKSWIIAENCPPT